MAVRKGVFYRDGTAELAQLHDLSMSLARFKVRRETVFPVVLAGTITWCSGFPAAVPQTSLFEVDKLGHFAAYGALATAVVRHPALRNWKAPGLWWAIVLASGYGLGDEFRQSLTHGVRSPDWHDWVADTAGAITAVTLYLRWPWYRRVMELRMGKRRAQAVSGSPEVPSDK